MSTYLEDDLVIAGFKPILNNSLMEKNHAFDPTIVVDHEERAFSQRLKQKATGELSRHELSQPAWTKAMDKANQNEIRARSFYVDYRVEELRHDKFDTERKESSRISDQAREKSKYENAVFLLLLVVCLAIALIFGKLL
jgi:hypothetical protein